MKKTVLSILIICTFCSCDLFDELTNEEVIAGLKEALTIGSETAANSASVENGFWGNPLIRIPLPPEAQTVKEVLESPLLSTALSALNVNVESLMSAFWVQINRAAEEAAKGATVIFVGAVREMTIIDGFNILKGGETAATEYLRENSTEPLKESFTPVVRTAVETVNVTSFWTPIADIFNHPIVRNIHRLDPITPNLEEFITERAIDGLMTLIAEQEKKIRTDPLAQVTPLLRRVFGDR